MSDNGKHPVEILWRMQQEAMAGHAPEHDPDARRAGGLAFGVGELRLVAELTGFMDIVACPPVTPVPGTRDWVRGICSVRGILYSVVDFGLFLEVSPPAKDNNGHLLVLNDAELGCGLLVPRVYGLRYFTEEHEPQDPSILDRAIQPYATEGFLQDDQLWGVLDIERLKSAEAFLSIERTGHVKEVVPNGDSATIN